MLSFYNLVIYSLIIVSGTYIHDAGINKKPDQLTDPASLKMYWLLGAMVPGCYRLLSPFRHHQAVGRVILFQVFHLGLGPVYYNFSILLAQVSFRMEPQVGIFL
ncbi:hypothetical protein CLV82_1796 [Zeaxanthinibacter enoshimensis]|uniref:Uncharacterized protein n=1 Tax=Zeaxanthinibacter enoshimensis TaxID=392009 RepID=A0A4R6TJN9_9FLAO|nr:hypothetical protein CLV82_1796 [Zeaxanthinibacter enoshimensis]